MKQSSRTTPAPFTALLRVHPLRTAIANHPDRLTDVPRPAADALKSARDGTASDTFPLWRRTG